MRKHANILEQFYATLPDDMVMDYRSKECDVWSLSDDGLLTLVFAGEKTATAGLLADHDKVPSVGDLGIIENVNEEPRCVIEYTRIEIRPFMEVDFEFAKAEGEGFADIEDWRREHRTVFKEWTNGAFRDEALILCEWFKLIYPI